MRKKPHLDIPLDKDTHAECKSAADKQGMTAAAWGRIAVKEKLRRQSDMPEVIAIVQSSPCPIILTSLEGYTVAVSPALEKLCDRREEEFIGKKPGDLLRGKESTRARKATGRSAIQESRLPPASVLLHSSRRVLTRAGI